MLEELKCMKSYIKPEIKLLDIRPEERLAANSNNCHAERGKAGCAPAVLWSHGSKNPQ